MKKSILYGLFLTAISAGALAQANPAACADRDTAIRQAVELLEKNEPFKAYSVLKETLASAFKPQASNFVCSIGTDSIYQPVLMKDGVPVPGATGSKVIEVLLSALKANSCTLPAGSRCELFSSRTPAYGNRTSYGVRLNGVTVYYEGECSWFDLSSGQQKDSKCGPVEPKDQQAALGEALALQAGLNCKVLPTDVRY